MTGAAVLAVNAGSSSIKVTIFKVGPDKADLSRSLDIVISNIGQPVSMLQLKPVGATAKVEELPALNHSAACDIAMQKLAEAIPVHDILMIGHRVVHGGNKFAQPTPLQDISKADWESLSQIDPLHIPVAHTIAAYFSERYANIPQVASFDTSFFDSLPRAAKLISIPKKYFEMGVRRYGFHGLSYASLLEAFGHKAGSLAQNGRVILAHLGSGASVTATRQGKPIDTTMGLTPASGVTMSTRAGDLDPGIFGFLHRHNHMTSEEFEHMVNFESGLLGVSGITGDMEKLLTLEATNEDAALAIELFVRSVKKAIGGLAALLGGVDSLIFSGGIGERSAVLRSRICDELGYMGVELDEVANQRHDFLISSGQSRAGVHVIPADEAQIIAKQTIELLRNQREA